MNLSNGVEPADQSQPTATNSLIARNRSHTRKRAQGHHICRGLDCRVRRSQHLTLIPFLVPLTAPRCPLLGSTIIYLTPDTRRIVGHGLDCSWWNQLTVSRRSWWLRGGWRCRSWQTVRGVQGDTRPLAMAACEIRWCRPRLSGRTSTGSTKQIEPECSAEKCSSFQRFRTVYRGEFVCSVLFRD